MDKLELKELIKETMIEVELERAEESRKIEIQHEIEDAKISIKMCKWSRLLLVMPLWAVITFINETFKLGIQGKLIAHIPTMIAIAMVIVTETTIRCREKECKKILQ